MGADDCYVRHGQTVALIGRSELAVSSDAEVEAVLARWRLMAELALRAFDQRVCLVPLVTMGVVERWFGSQRGAAVIDVVVEPEGRDGPGGPIPYLGLAIGFGSIAKRFGEPARAAVKLPVNEDIAHLVVVVL